MTLSPEAEMVKVDRLMFLSLNCRCACNALVNPTESVSYMLITHLIKKLSVYPNVDFEHWFFDEEIAIRKVLGAGVGQILW